MAALFGWQRNLLRMGICIYAVRSTLRCVIFCTFPHLKAYKCIQINVQAVVDAFKRFISFEMGWPGSVPDVSIWKKSHLWVHRHQYFEPGEYLLADKGMVLSSKSRRLLNELIGYPSTPYLLRPFTEPEVNEFGPGPEKRRRRRFNKLISNKRIFVEHAFGMLKGRFPALKELGTPDDIEDAYRTVESLMTLHNLCIDLGDHPEDICDFDPHDDTSDDVAEVDVDVPHYGGATVGEPANIPPAETDAALRAAGYQMRFELLDRLCAPE